MAIELGRTDEIGSLLLLALAAGIFRVTADFPSGFGETGPGFYPRALAVLIALFALVQLVGSIGDADREPHEITLEETLRVLGVLALLVGYVLAMPRLGFVPATVAFLAVAMWYSGVRAYGRLAVVAVGLTLVLHYIFAEFLRIPLPEGTVIDVTEWLPALPLEVFL